MHAEHILRLLLSASQHVTIVRDGFPFQEKLTQGARSTKRETNCGKVLKAIKSSGSLSIAVSKGTYLPPAFSQCLHALYDELAGASPNLSLVQAMTEGDDEVVRQALQAGPDSIILARDSDYLFFPDVNYCNVDTLRINLAQRKVQLSYTTWERRRDAVRGQAPIPDADVKHYFAALALVWGNDRIEPSTFINLRPHQARLDLRQARNMVWSWCEDMTSIGGGERLIDVLSQQARLSDADCNRVRHAAEWYTDLAQKQIKPQLAQLGTPLLRQFQKHNFPKDVLAMLLGDNRATLGPLLEEGSRSSYHRFEPLLQRLWTTAQRHVVSLSPDSRPHLSGQGSHTIETRTCTPGAGLSIVITGATDVDEHCEDRDLAALALDNAIKSELFDAIQIGVLRQLAAYASHPVLPRGVYCSCAEMTRTLQPRMPMLSQDKLSSFLSFFALWSACVELSTMAYQVQRQNVGKCESLWHLSDSWLLWYMYNEAQEGRACRQHGFVPPGRTVHSSNTSLQKTGAATRETSHRERREVAAAVRPGPNVVQHRVAAAVRPGPNIVQHRVAAGVSRADRDGQQSWRQYPARPQSSPNVRRQWGKWRRGASRDEYGRSSRFHDPGETARSTSSEQRRDYAPVYGRGRARSPRAEHSARSEGLSDGGHAAAGSHSRSHGYFSRGGKG